MKNYELLYILPATMTSKEISDNFKEVIKNIEKLEGKMLETLVEHPFLIKSEASKEESAEELQGLTVVKKKLAYPIKKNKFGFYCLVNFSAEGEKLKEIDNYLKMNNNILRHIIVQENPMTKEELARLHKLFARKRAEQEKEEKQKEAKETPKEKKEEIKTLEIKPVIEEIKTKKVIVEKEKEKPKEEAVEKKQEEKEIEMEDKKEKIKTVKKKTAAKTQEEKVIQEKPKTKKVDDKKEEKSKEEIIKKKSEEDKKETGDKEESKREETKKESSRKKKIKLEDLEDKLDEILEDTML